jgi:hypothetical protein
MRWTVRSSLPIAAMLAVAGCAGAGSSAPPATSAQGAAGTAGRPFAVSTIRDRLPYRSVRSNYATKGSLVFEADLSQEDVNIYQTKDLASNPPRSRRCTRTSAAQTA